MASLTYIYALVDPRNQSVFYVGKTVMELKVRLSSHLYHSKKCRTPKESYISDLAATGLKPQIIELARLPDASQEEVAATEQAWIDFYGLTHDLTNIGFGGQGGGERCVRVEWTAELDDLLGKVSDSELAERIGCDRKTVEYRRAKLGIPRLPQQNFVVPPMGGWNRLELPAEIESLLGQQPDYKLAAMMGVDKSVIQRRRQELGIPSYAESTNHKSRFKKGNPHPRWSRVRKE